MLELSTGWKSSRPNASGKSAIVIARTIEYIARIQVLIAWKTIPNNCVGPGIFFSRKLFRAVLTMLGQVRKVALAGDSSNDVGSHDKPLLESEIRERTDQLLLAVAEVDYQENLIRERQEGINVIHRDVNTIHNLFLDVASHVSAQGETLDHIESNVRNARDQTSQANEQLSVATRRAPSRRKTCLLFLLLVLLFFVMAAMFKSIFHGSRIEGSGQYNLHI